MALLLNKYPDNLIQTQFDSVLKKLNIIGPISIHNYQKIHLAIISTPLQEKLTVDYEKNLFIHFTYCTNMRTFPKRFYTLWEKYFSSSPINDINPILGTRNVHNLQRQLAYKEKVR